MKGGAQMVKNRLAFAGSVLFAFLWLGVSAALAVPWLRGASAHLPLWYAAWAIVGIALLPGFLMSAMFVSNCLHTRTSPPAYAGGRPVCVIICARNEQACIYETVRSVVRQQYAGEIRILCVNNASSDGTADEMARARRDLQCAGRSIRLLECETPGKAHALNAAFEYVDTDIFLTVDADTLLAEHAVRALVGTLSRGGAGCVAGNLLVSEPRSWVEKMQIYDYLVSIAAVKRYQGSYGATLVAQGALSAYDTRIVRALGGWTPGAGEDIVLTYRILGAGRLSLYEPQAVAYTRVPQTLGALCRQRIRWARGMLEGFRAVCPWRQPGFAGGYFEALNLSIIYLDLSFVFGFLVGVLFALFGQYWLVGWQTLALFPLMLVNIAAAVRFQRKLGVPLCGSVTGFLNFLAFFQVLQSVCSLIGYAQALIRQKLKWK